MRILVVDDEQDAIEFMEIAVRKLMVEGDLFFSAASIDSAVEMINSEKPDLVFLDIQMPFGSGFDVIERSSFDDCQVVFTTAFDQYALKAIKFNAYDYLLKPIDLDELQGIITAIREQLADKNHTLKKRDMDQLRQNIHTISKIAIPYKNGFVYLRLEDISHIEADGSYSTLFTNEGRYITSKRLKYFEDLLCEHEFCRVHASFIINLRQLKMFSKSNGGEVTLENDIVISVSASRRKNLLDRI